MGLFERLHVHIPYHALRERLPLLLDNGLNPEIFIPRRELGGLLAGGGADLAAALTGAGLRTTVHGPFSDLSPGAIDEDFRALTLARMQDALRAAAPFAPAAVVFHPGFDPLRFRDQTARWLRNSQRTWKALLPPPPGLEHTPLLVENIFESEPETLRALLDRLPSPTFGFCLDTGHLQLFSQGTMEPWFDALAPRLREVHLHDNRGESDEHLPPGQGKFDFRRLFRLIEGLDHPVLATIEMHREEHIWEALAYLRAERVL